MAVHAFEAAPETYKRLLKNMELNNVEGVKTINKAVSNTEGKTEFIYCPEISGSSSFRDILNMEGSEKISVDTISLDNYCKVNELTPNFLKIDVEGAEKQVIEGFMETLRKGKKPILFVEILRKWSEKYGYNADYLLKLIIDQEYNAFAYDQNEGIKEVFEISDSTIQTNFLFIPYNINHVEIIKDIEQYIRTDRLNI